MEHQEYYIYKITCLPTNQSYIGQTQKHKYKDGKPYNYGITGRWCDHVSSSKRSNTPLHTAIREHGNGSFTHSILETVREESADSREAYWISTLNTTVPNGYNVMSHSRCKHRDATDIVSLYPNATSVELKHIHKDGQPRLVYIYVDTPVGRKRLTFGQKKEDTFDSALQTADHILQQFREKGVEVLSSDKRQQFMDKELERIRITPFNKTMVAVYITDTNKKQTRICFGGKHVSFEDAKEQARCFIRGLESKCVEDNLSKSQQQVAPCLDEVNSK